MDKSTISLLKNKSKLQIDQIDNFETISDIVQVEKGYVIKRIIKNTTNKIDTSIIVKAFFVVFI